MDRSVRHHWGNAVNVSDGSLAPLILLVDDTTDLLSVWALLLEESGFRVLTASSGFAGLARARESLPDLVITDYMMPGMDGLAMCRSLRLDDRFKSIPFIMWTAALTAPCAPEVDEIMYKPVTVETLTRRIATLLAGRIQPSV
ncbi:response regulator [Caballeronia sp. LZ035]|uniref:response regulator n=1 Tax=Caballeronia sp. LZ035 TaxID=3038568 RepID=UPI00285E5036|nr:response regulator [Caballeronia sp. LZ035]MDR5756338.1 response regulator [Caballeronia sp. LZ035]